MGFPGSSVSKESALSAGDPGSIPGSGRSLEGGRQPTPVFLPGESHGQRSLVGCSPWGRKESGMTERLTQPQQNTAHRCGKDKKLILLNTSTPLRII